MSPFSSHSASPALVVVGELNVDLVFERLNRKPALDAERRAEGMVLTLGSSSAIFAANSAALGLSVAFVGRAGEDLFGDFVRRTLARRGVDTTHVITSPETPTGATAIFTHDARRGMITYPGAMDHLRIDDIPWAAVRQAQHLHLSSFYLQRALRPDCATLFARAKEAGLTTSLDTNWDPDETWGDDVFEVLEHVDVFFPNDEEARRISGCADLDDAMRVLSQPGCTVVVTCGAEGAKARANERTMQQPAVPVEPVDAVGAGDSFNAGFLAQYLRDRPLEVCLRYGVLAGAFSTQKAGGIAAFDDPEPFDAFVQEHRVESKS